MVKKRIGEPFHPVVESEYCLFFLSAKLKEKRSEKLSIILEPGMNSG